MVSHNLPDEKVLELSQKLCREFRVTRMKPQKLVWSETVPSDECGFAPPAFRSREIRLNLALKDKLTSEEFGPIIASSLTFVYKIRKGEEIRLFLPMLLPWILVLSIGLLFKQTVDVRTIVTIAIIVWPLIALVSATRFARHLRRLKLIADKRAADFVGRESLLSTLTKIEGLRLKDVEMLKRGGFRAILSNKPTIDQRIRNLSVSQT